MNLFPFIVTFFIIFHGISKIKAAATQRGAERPRHHRGDPKGEPSSQKRNKGGKFGLNTNGSNLEGRKGQEERQQKQQVAQKQMVAEQVKQVVAHRCAILLYCSWDVDCLVGQLTKQVLNQVLLQVAHQQKQQVAQEQKVAQEQMVAEQVKQVLKQLRQGLMQVVSVRMEPKKVPDEKKKRRGQSWSWQWKVQSQDSRAQLYDNGGGSHGTLVSKGW